MKVPFIDLARREPDLLEKLKSRAIELIETNNFVGGPLISGLEKSLASYTGVGHAVCCANGTDALQIGLRALGVGPGDRVLVPELTFWASFEAVVNVGAQPIPVDVDLKGWHWTEKILSEAIDKWKPKAAMLVHLYGWAAAETKGMRKLCQNKGVQLIEDSAQSFAVELEDEEPLFKGALLSTTSFYPAKVYGASGDAGALFCQDAELAERVLSMRDHGRSQHYAHAHVGWNSRMGAYEAMYLTETLPYLAARLESRRNACNYYRRHLAGTSAQVLGPAQGIRENGYLAVLKVDPTKREGLIENLNQKGVGTGVVYPMPISTQLAARAYLPADLAQPVNCQQICDSVLNLPCFANMREEELEYVTKTLRSLL